MAIDTVLVLLSLLSFAALVIIWVAAPLQSENVGTSTAAAPEQAGTTVPA